MRHAVIHQHALVCEPGPNCGGCSRHAQPPCEVRCAEPLRRPPADRQRKHREQYDQQINDAFIALRPALPKKSIVLADLAEVGAVRDRSADWVQGFMPDNQVDICAVWTKWVVAWRADFFAVLPPAVLPADDVRL